MIALHTIRPIRLLTTCVGIALPFLTAGCQLVSSKWTNAPTQTDRLMQEYSELRSGRFAVIADFQNEAHMELFQIIKVSETANCVLDRKHGLPKTGRDCLLYTAGCENDVMVINNKDATNWFLNRDWRPYDLLLMSIHAPRPDITAALMVAAGPPERRLAVETAIPLQRGWNRIRLDLGEIAERIPLDDIREMRLSLPGIKKKARLYVDDVILTGHREDLFGDSRNTGGELYVQRAGRRWHIGAGGRFELTFCNGKIVQWFNLASDPYRLRNLVKDTFLGPRPVVIEETDSSTSGFDKLGQAVVVREQITEANSVRIVVTCDWHFVDDPSDGIDGRPFQHWQYTIYPTGQLYVATSCTAATKSWSPEKLGLAVNVAAFSQTDPQLRAVPGGGLLEGQAIPLHAIARSYERNMLLLYCPAPIQGEQDILTQLNMNLRHASLVASSSAPPAEIASWRCHLVLASADDVSNNQARDRAIDYTRPAAVQIKAGAWAALDGSTSNKPGFDLDTGCFSITPQDNYALILVDGTEHPVFSPAFRIEGSADRQVWVYVDYLIFEDVARDVRGDLIFQLPNTIREQTLIEVLVQTTPTSAGA